MNILKKASRKKKSEDASKSSTSEGKKKSKSKSKGKAPVEVEVKSRKGSDDTSEIVDAVRKDVLPLLFVHYTTNQMRSSPENITIFDLINPLTEKPFHEKEVESAVGKLYHELKKSIVELGDSYDNSLKQFTEQFDAYKDVDYSHGTIPQFRASTGDKESDDKKRLAFQKQIRQFLKTREPSQQLVLLNKIQRDTPFLIADPSRKLMPRLKYGYADLLRFLCEPVKSGRVARFSKTGDPSKNPFYQPIRYYPIPDEEGNELLERIHSSSYKYQKEKLKELEYLYKEIKSKGISKEKKMNKLNMIIIVMKELYDIQKDPVSLSKLIKGQERPMESYRNAHFIELLRQLNTRKKMAPATYGEKAPMNTGINLVGDKIKAVKGRRKKTKSKSKSKKGKGKKTKRSVSESLSLEI